MFTLTMRFTLPEDTDWSRIPALMEDRARQLYSNMPGLISKAFLKSDIVAGARSKFGEPTYQVHRVAAYLDRGKVYVPAAASTS